MRTFFSAAAALLAGFVLAFAPAADARVVGSGRSATETRSVSDFEAIAAGGSIDIVVRQASKEAVQIEADDNLLPLVETTVENTSQGRTLVVRLKRGENISHGKPIRAIVDVVRLSSISCAGSGDVTIGALKTPALKLSIAGSSDARIARIAGLDAESFELRISGSGPSGFLNGEGEVRLAEAGFVAAPDAINTVYGTVLGEAFDPAQMADGLGERWLEVRRVHRFKCPSPCGQESWRVPSEQIGGIIGGDKEDDPCLSCIDCSVDCFRPGCLCREGCEERPAAL